MDIFEKFIKDNKDNDCRALTYKSYNEIYKKQNHKDLKNVEINSELATYGDALLKFALCQILLDKCEDGLSEEKKKYESDEFLIKKVAKRYNLLEYIKFDRNDSKIKQEYIYYKNDNTKYIATTVDAVLGAIYQQDKDFKSICELVEQWTKL